jgi:hypothetical protein
MLLDAIFYAFPLTKRDALHPIEISYTSRFSFSLRVSIGIYNSEWSGKGVST